MVVGEAMTAGCVVLTTRLVGASECLPPEYAPWLLDAPDAAALAERALQLLDDPSLRARLAAAGVAAATALDKSVYARESIAMMLDGAAAD